MEQQIIDSPVYLQKFDGSMSLTTLTPTQAMQRHEMVIAFVKSSMKEGRDYGIIPGTDKRSLWKPGAEKLCTLFGYSIQLVPAEIERDWTGREHGGEPFFFYEYKCKITHGAIAVVESYGSCNSFEKKYRYREGKRKCPKCQKETIRRSKPRPDDPPSKPMGWYCWSKIGGCGATFVPDEKTITSQTVGMVKNDEICDQVNTIDKMAQKRALVGAAVIACNASEFFSDQFDEEDFSDGALSIKPIVTEDSPATIQAKMQAARNALRGDQGDLEMETPYQPEGMPSIEQAITPPPVENGKSASLKFQAFVTWANEWVKGNGKDYAKPDGLANMYHLLGRIGKLGFASVTEQNADDIKAALESFVKGKVDTQ